MSDTPRTDAEAFFVLDANEMFPREHNHEPDGTYVSSGFARSLERQLAEAQAEIEADDRNAQGFLDLIHKLEATIERMKPVVLAAREMKRDYREVDGFGPGATNIFFEAVGDYEAKEPK
jgi:hypothetical protein